MSESESDPTTGQPLPEPVQPIAYYGPPSQLSYSAVPMLPTSGMAITSLVLGIVSLFFCAWYIAFPSGILAIIFGLIARGQISRGERTGAGMAKAGVIMGCIGLTLLVVMVIAILGFAAFMLHNKH